MDKRDDLNDLLDNLTMEEIVVLDAEVDPEGKLVSAAEKRVEVQKDKEKEISKLLPLLQLPEIVLANITSFLPLSDFKNARLTCKQMHAVSFMREAVQMRAIKLVFKTEYSQCFENFTDSDMNTLVNLLCKLQFGKYIKIKLWTSASADDPTLKQVLDNLKDVEVITVGASYLDRVAISCPLVKKLGLEFTNNMEIPPSVGKFKLLDNLKVIGGGETFASPLMVVTIIDLIPTLTSLTLYGMYFGFFMNEDENKQLGKTVQEKIYNAKHIQSWEISQTRFTGLTITLPPAKHVSVSFRVQRSRHDPLDLQINGGNLHSLVYYRNRLVEWDQNQFKKLKHLVIGRIEFMADNLPLCRNLKTLKIDGCTNVQCYLNALASYQPPHLEYICLDSCCFGSYFSRGESSGYLNSLVNLVEKLESIKHLEMVFLPDITREEISSIDWKNVKSQSLHKVTMKKNDSEVNWILTDFQH